MNRIVPIVAAALLLALLAAPALAGEYGWTISSSSTDPHQNTGSARPGAYWLYLWFTCDNGGGMAAAEFDLVAQNLSISAIAPPDNPDPNWLFLNAGTPTELLLAAGQCPRGPILAFKLLVSDASGQGGTVCLAPSRSNSRNLTVDCQGGSTGFDNDWVGYAAGGQPCKSSSDLCGSGISLEDASWGTVKSLWKDR